MATSKSFANWRTQPPGGSASDQPAAVGSVRGEAGQDRGQPLSIDAAERERRLRQVRQLAGLMDDRFRIPGTPIRVGWDSIVGLIPGVGDTVAVASHAWLLWHAQKLGVGRGVQLRMAGNAVIDLVGGAVPLVGDLFDVYWKSNRRNARLLENAVLRMRDSGGSRP